MKQVHGVTVAERQQYCSVSLVFYSHKYLNSLHLKDLRANAKTLPQSLDWAACFYRMTDAEGQ